MSTFAVILQIAGLTLLPFALFVGLTAEHGMLPELLLLAVGAGFFYLGRLIGKRPS